MVSTHFTDDDKRRIVIVTSTVQVLSQQSVLVYNIAVTCILYDLVINLGPMLTQTLSVLSQEFPVTF